MKLRPSRFQNSSLSAFQRLLLASSLLAAPFLHAATYYWDNAADDGFGAAGGTWSSTASLWSTSDTGAGAASGTVFTTTSDTVNFGTGSVALTTGTITVSGTVSTGNITFGSASGGITLSGGTLSVGGGRVISAQNNSNVIGSNIQFSGGNGTISFSRNTANAGTMTINGEISGTGNVTFTTPNVSSGGTNQIIILGAANSWTGNTTITTGNTGNSTIIQAGIANALPTTTVLTLDGGNGSGSGRTVAFDLANRNHTIAGLTNVTGRTSRNQEITNRNTGTATLTINNAADHTFSGEIINGNGTVRVTKSGAGTQTLSGSNTYTGTTTISAGVLQIGNGGTTGTLGSNSNTSIATGAELRIDRSTDNFGYAYTGALSGSGTVNLPAERRFNFQTNNQTASGDLAFVVNGYLGINTSSGTKEVRLGELSGNGTIQRAGSPPTTPAPPYTLIIGGKNTSSTYSGTLQNIAELGVEKVGSGTLTLTNTFSHGAATTVTAGTLALGSAGNIPNTSAFTIAAGATLSTTAKTSFAMPAAKTFTFSVNPAGTGSSGTLTAQTLDITAGVCALNITGTLDDPAYVLATYSTLTGTAFATAPNNIPSGYELKYDYQGNKIALVKITTPSNPYETWAGVGVAFGDDANGDGIDNGLAFLLGAANPQANALGLLPATSQSGGALVLTFQMRNAAARGTAKLNLQHSSDLGISDPWATVLVPDTTPDPQASDVSFIISAGTLPDTVTVTATIAAGQAANGKLFGRCSASEN